MNHSTPKKSRFCPAWLALFTGLLVPATADAATIVDCKDDHRFEVAESVDMRAYPGSEFAPDAAPADDICAAAIATG